MTPRALALTSLVAASACVRAAAPDAGLAGSCRVTDALPAGDRWESAAAADSAGDPVALLAALDAERADIARELRDLRSALDAPSDDAAPANVEVRVDATRAARRFLSRYVFVSDAPLRAEFDRRVFADAIAVRAAGAALAVGDLGAARDWLDAGDQASPALAACRAAVDAPARPRRRGND
jgi:hypothetical protein